MNEELKKEWERELREKWNSLGLKNMSAQFSEVVADWWIEKTNLLLAKQQEEFVRRIPKLEGHPQDECFDDYCDRCNSRKGWEAGYQQCIADIKSKLNKNQND